MSNTGKTTISLPLVLAGMAAGILAYGLLVGAAAAIGDGQWSDALLRSLVSSIFAMLAGEMHERAAT